MVLLTGANGFLGYHLIKSLLSRHIPFVATGRGTSRFPQLNYPYSSLDFTDPFAVHDLFEAVRPSQVLHAGAISQPDTCEQNQALAYQVNVEGTIHLLTNAAAHHSRFLYVSTDFVFDGRKGMYKETDTPAPVNYYGRTKLEGEEAVQELSTQWSIIRTVLVYGPSFSGRNNIGTLLAEKIRQKEKYKVVDDQLRTPTYVEDLAGGILDVIEQQQEGIFHLSGPEQATPYQLAMKLCKIMKGDPSLFEKVTADTFSQPAIRPLKTGFDISKAKEVLGYSPLNLEEGLRKMVEEWG